MSKTTIVAAIAVLFVALVSFAFFSALSNPPASAPALAAATATFAYPTIGFPTPDFRPTVPPLPPPPFTPPGTPLPTPDLGPSPTPRPIVPSPVWTPIPAVVTGWTTFTGTSGFSFIYPTGWFVFEEYDPNAQLQKVNIQIINWRDSLPPDTTIIPGGISIHLLDIVPQAQIPKTGPSFTVGLQKLPGYQFVYTRENPPPTRPYEPQFWFVEKAIQIFFTAGNKQWGISASFYPPKQNADQFVQVFYQVVGSLNYESK